MCLNYLPIISCQKRASLEENRVFFTTLCFKIHANPVKYVIMRLMSNEYNISVRVI